MSSTVVGFEWVFVDKGRKEETLRRGERELCNANGNYLYITTSRIRGIRVKGDVF